jgi:hypothetical protein
MGALDISVLKKLLFLCCFFWSIILDHETDSLKKILWDHQLLFVGLYWGYDARLWPCEEAMCWAEGFYESTQFLVDRRFQGVYMHFSSGQILWIKQLLGHGNLLNLLIFMFFLVVSQGFSSVFYNSHGFGTEATRSY